MRRASQREGAQRARRPALLTPWQLNFPKMGGIIDPALMKAGLCVAVNDVALSIWVCSQGATGVAGVARSAWKQE